MAPDPRRAAAALCAPTPLPARRRPLTPATRCDPLPSLLRRGGMVRTEKIRCECRRRPLARGSKWCQRRCNPPATLRAAAAVCCECVPRPRCMPSLPRQQTATTDSRQPVIAVPLGCCRSTGMIMVVHDNATGTNPTYFTLPPLCLSASGLLSLGPVSWYPQGSTLRASISLCARAEPAVAEARLEQLLDLGLWQRAQRDLRHLGPLLGAHAEECLLALRWHEADEALRELGILSGDAEAAHLVGVRVEVGVRVGVGVGVRAGVGVRMSPPRRRACW